LLVVFSLEFLGGRGGEGSAVSDLEHLGKLVDSVDVAVDNDLDSHLLVSQLGLAVVEDVKLGLDVVAGVHLLPSVGNTEKLGVPVAEELDLIHGLRHGLLDPLVGSGDVLVSRLIRLPNRGDLRGSGGSGGSRAALSPRRSNEGNQQQHKNRLGDRC